MYDNLAKKAMVETGDFGQNGRLIPPSSAPKKKLLKKF